MTGLSYARGPYQGSTGTAGSAFSIGAPLMYDNNSNLSEWDTLTTANVVIGVAEASSLQSLDNQVPFCEVQPGTVFWSLLSSDAVSNATAGLNRDLINLNGDWFVNSSANTPAVRIAVGSALSDVVESGVSRVMVTFDPDAALYQGS